MFGTLRGRLIISHLLLIFLGFPLVGAVLIYVLEENVILVNLSTQLSRQAALLAEFSDDYPEIWTDGAAAQRFVNRFRPRMTAQLMLVGVDGRLLASSDPADAHLTGTLLAGPGLDLARRGETAQLTSHSQDLMAEIADIWVPARSANGQVVGLIRVTHRLANVRERFERLRTNIIQVTAGGMLIGLLLAVALARRLERPIGELTGAVTGLASGEVSERLPERGPAELRTLASAFNLLVERLEMLRAGRRQLLANLIHELGRPLGALRAASQALLDGAAEDPTLGHDLITGIDRELGVLQRLLDDLRRFHQRDAAPLDLAPQPVALSGWLNALLPTWREAARLKGVDWQADIPPDLPTLPIDSDRLAQALGNLVSNAIKFTPAGRPVSVSAGTEGDALWIAVADGGGGIPSEDQPRVFEPFFRGSRRRLPEGMGLGLTIARDLVQAHDGRLVVDSAPERGSVFTIWLPL